MVGTPRQKLFLPLALCVLTVAGCEADDSMPKKPRTANFLTPDVREQENAEKRALEKPTTDVPTAQPHSDARTTIDRRVLTLQAGGGGGGGLGGTGGTGGAIATPGGGVTGGTGNIGGGTGSIGTGGSPTGLGATPSGAGANPSGPGLLPGTLGSTPINPGSNVAPAFSNPSGNPFNTVLNELGYQGPSDWGAFGYTRGPMDIYGVDSYAGTIPHLPPNPGTKPIPGVTPAPSGDWSVDNSWGQGMVLENYPHRPWPEVTVNYESGAVLHNPVYYFSVQPHLHVARYIQTYRADLQNKNFKSHWFYLNTLAMPIWVALEPQAVPELAPAVNTVNQYVPESLRGNLKSDAYEIPWFYVQTVTLPVVMALEPPFVQRISARPSEDPNFRGHLPVEGTIVPAPIPGRLRWDYPFLNADGTVRPVTPTAADPTPPTTFESTTVPATQPKP